MKAAALAGGTIEGEETWMATARHIGKPLFAGLAAFAVVGGVMTWVVVNVLWTLAVRLRRCGAARRAQESPGQRAHSPAAG